MSIYQTNINTIVATLYRMGLRHVVISPGSRNAPLIMAFARFGKIICTSVADERSAAFVALGMAKQLQEPVAVLCTSGSAVLNLYPAIAEAYYMQVPLFVITADRPAEMLDRWDGQTIHQSQVFGPHILASAATPEDTEADHFNGISETVQHLFNTCNGILKGPVHLNFPLKEPLYAASGSAFIYPETEIEVSESASDKQWEFLLNAERFVEETPKVLIIHGASHEKTFSGEETGIGQSHYAVVLSDSISNRHAEANIRNWETVLLNANEEQQQMLVPDLLITTGKMILNKSLKILFRKYKPVRHWHIAENGYCADTFFTDPVVMNLKPELFFKKFKSILPEKESDYYKVWKGLSLKADQQSSSVISEQFNAFSGVESVLKYLPENIILHLANSMSVRYVAYLNSEFKNSWQLHSNRGVSGIDGCTSTAMGAALVDKKTHVLITGDIAFFYDINALWQQHLPSNLKIILLNDFGGGIFKNIDGPAGIPELNPYLFTPHQLNASLLAEHFGLDYRLATSEAGLVQALPEWLTSGKASILEIQTDSQINSNIFNKYKQQTL